MYYWKNCTVWVVLWWQRSRNDHHLLSLIRCAGKPNLPVLWLCSLPLTIVFLSYYQYFSHLHRLAILCLHFPCPTLFSSSLPYMLRFAISERLYLRFAGYACSAFLNYSNHLTQCLNLTTNIIYANTLPILLSWHDLIFVSTLFAISTYNCTDFETYWYMNKTQR